MESEVIRKAALEWISKNTTLDITTDPLPASVELFIEKYGEVMGLRAGVTSESISGLSQSFNVSDVSTLLKRYAEELLGAEFVNSDVRFVCVENRFK